MIRYDSSSRETFRSIHLYRRIHSRPRRVHGINGEGLFDDRGQLPLRTPSIFPTLPLRMVCTVVALTYPPSPCLSHVLNTMHSICWYSRSLKGVRVHPRNEKRRKHSGVRTHVGKQRHEKLTVMVVLAGKGPGTEAFALSSWVNLLHTAARCRLRNVFCSGSHRAGTCSMGKRLS